MHTELIAPASAEQPEAQAEDLARWLGRREAFGTIAGRCSGADVECLRQIRNRKLFKNRARSWDEFCKKELRLSRRKVDDDIRYLEEFGPQFFQLTQLTRIAPLEYRAIAQHVAADGVHVDGRVVALLETNAEQVAAAVDDLRRRAEPERARTKEPAAESKSEVTRAAEPAAAAEREAEPVLTEEPALQCEPEPVSAAEPAASDGESEPIRTAEPAAESKSEVTRAAEPAASERESEPVRTKEPAASDREIEPASAAEPAASEREAEPIRTAEPEAADHQAEPVIDPPDQILRACDRAAALLETTKFLDGLHRAKLGKALRRLLNGSARLGVYSAR